MAMHFKLYRSLPYRNLYKGTLNQTLLSVEIYDLVFKLWIFFHVIFNNKR